MYSVDLDQAASIWLLIYASYLSFVIGSATTEASVKTLQLNWRFKGVNGELAQGKEDLKISW